MDSTPFWYGDLPFDQRQTIEDYQTQVEPMMEDIVAQLVDLGLGQPQLAAASELQGCGGIDVDGYEVEGSSVQGDPVDVDAAAHVIDAILVPAGLGEKTDHRDDTMASLTWNDTANGGYFDLTIVPGSHTAFSYASGCRPSDGSTTDRIRDRVTPDWEQSLPPFTGDPQSDQSGQ